MLSHGKSDNVKLGHGKLIIANQVKSSQGKSAYIKSG